MRKTVVQAGDAATKIASGSQLRSNVKMLTAALNHRQKLHVMTRRRHVRSMAPSHLPSEVDKNTTTDQNCDDCRGESPKSVEANHFDHDSQKSAIEPCLSHLTSAFERYTAYLESARCICTSVLSQQLDSCCGKTKLQTPPRRNHRACCSSSAVSIRSSSSNITQRSLKRDRSCKSVTKSCVPSSKTKSTCGKDDEISPAYAPPGSILPPRAARVTTTEASDDVEKAGSSEHVLLEVSGMTCTGCANNLERALQAVEAVSNPRATFVTGTADFDIDASITTVDDVIKHIQEATQFKCVRYQSDNQSLVVSLSAEQAKAFSSHLPTGVDSVEEIGKDSYNITYDPCNIGARAVLAASGGGLAPPGSNGRQLMKSRDLYWKAGRTVLALLLTIPVLVLSWSNVAIKENTKLEISLVLATGVQYLAYPEYYRPAVLSLVRDHVLEMEMLIVISISAAYGYSVVAAGLTLAGRDLELDAFFETSTLLITLIMLSRLVAAYSRKRAVQAVSMRSLQAQTAFLVDPSGNHQSIDARLLQFQDNIRILPHGQIVTDAEVLTGTSELDESMITGESVPVLKTAGSVVIAGTLNGSGILTARVTRLPGKNTITDIADLVDRAQSSKPKVQELADKIAGKVFIPVVSCITIVVFVIWLGIAFKVREQTAGRAIGTAISYAIAVLAISCPCALGLAVPMVLVVAGGVAAKGGVIVKSAEVLERVFRVSDVVFDKTGTLTLGNMEVVHESFIGQVTKDDVLGITHALVQDNQHPVAKAVAISLEQRSTVEAVLNDVISVPGSGIQASWNHQLIRVGNPTWLDCTSSPEVEQCLLQGLTVFCVTLESKLVAIFGLTSTIRPEAAGVVRELQQRKINVHIVSGDGARVVKNLANGLHIPLSNAVGSHTPADKQTYITKLMDQGKTTLFCGDGTNDAVAVAQADIGVQIGSSSDVTRATADVVLLSDLKGIIHLVDTSKAAYRRIIFNFAWSAIYNIFAILLASGAFVRVRIPPAYVGLGEMVSIVPVIVVALSMLYKRRGA